MLLTEELPPLGADILAVRGHTAIQGRVTNSRRGCVEVTLPTTDGQPDLAPTVDLWMRDGWDWLLHSDHVRYELPIPFPDMSGLTILPKAADA